MGMKLSGRRLIDAVLIGLGFVLIVAVLDLGVLHGATSRMLATSLLTWLMCSLPAAILIGHCALSEE
jgi:hypothetical protein